MVEHQWIVLEWNKYSNRDQLLLIDLSDVPLVLRLYPLVMSLVSVFLAPDCDCLMHYQCY